MTYSNFDKSLAEVLKHEGGYVNHPDDPGGMTNLGVTKDAYEEWVGYKVDERIMRSLTVNHVRALYRANYWKVVKGDELPAGLDLCVFDFAVNAGPARAARMLQLMVGANPDGRIGPVTIATVRKYVTEHDVPHAINRYQDLRMGYYQKLKHFRTFGRGWTRRVKEVTAAALRVAK